MKKIIIILICILIEQFGFSQKSISQSFWLKFKHAKTDTSKIKILLKAGDKYLDNYPDSALLLYNKAHKLAEKYGEKIYEVKTLRSIGKAYMLMGNFSKAYENNFKSLKILDELSSSSDKTVIKDIIKERASYYQSLGEIQYSQGNYSEALHYYQKDLSELEKLGDKSLIAFCYHRIGSIFKGLGKYPQAINYYQKSLSIYETTGNKGGMATSYNNLGMLHDLQGSYSLAIDYYQKALNIAIELADINAISGCNNNIGVVYEEMKNYPKALEYYNKALKNYEEHNNMNGMSICYANIGVIHKNNRNYKQAIEYLKKSQDICEELGDIIGISEVLVESANSKLELADSAKNTPVEKIRYCQEAIEFALRALSISKERNALPGINYASSILHRAYKLQGNPAKALEFAELEMISKDSLFNKEKNKQLTEIETKYQTEKKEKEIQLHKSEILKKNAFMEQQKIKQYATLSALVLIFTIAIIIFINYKQKRKANTLLTFKNTEITQQNEEIRIQRDLVTQQKEYIEHIHEEQTDSIRYAERIQQAVLPRDQYIKERIPGEFFILFRPRDMVSGDFYFVERRNNWLLITVADCTGHGVPGAFMSMLGISFLNEIIAKEETQSASHVLDELRNYVIHSLQQKGVQGEQQDGMDIAFIALNTETNELQFAGANNPLYLIPNNTKELIEIKPDKKPIGIYGDMSSFANNTIQVNKGDCLYIFSDGFIDQFGGENRKKFLSKRFKETLLQIAHLSMLEQKESLNTIFENWKGNGEQIDDVTVMGIKI